MVFTTLKNHQTRVVYQTEGPQQNALDPVVIGYKYLRVTLTPQHLLLHMRVYKNGRNDLYNCSLSC